MPEIEDRKKQVTEDWRLSCVIKWKQQRFMRQVECTMCSGRGKVGGGWADLDDPRECENCFGRGSVDDPSDTPIEQMPNIPKDLIEHMQKAWKEYFSK